MRERLSFQPFLGLSPEDRISDAKILWLFRERQAQNGLVEKFFQQFHEHLWVSALIPRGSQIIDASQVNTPKNRNKRKENRQIKEEKLPDGRDDMPDMASQKDRDARLTINHGKSHYGYNNHISIDEADKLIRRYKVTDVEVHDSQIFDDVLDGKNSGRSVWADSAHRSKECEDQLCEACYISHIHQKRNLQAKVEQTGKDPQPFPFEGTGQYRACLRL